MSDFSDKAASNICNENNNSDCSSDYDYNEDANIRHTYRKLKRKYHFCCMPQCADSVYALTHRFPKNKKRLMKWLHAIKISSLNDVIEKTGHKTPILCARHFRPTDYMWPDSRRLNNTAVPSLNLKTLNQLDICRQVKLRETWETELKRRENIRHSRLFPKRGKAKNVLADFETETERSCFIDVIQETSCDYEDNALDYDLDKAETITTQSYRSVEEWINSIHLMQKVNDNVNAVCSQSIHSDAQIEAAATVCANETEDVPAATILQKNLQENLAIIQSNIAAQSTNVALNTLDASMANVFTNNLQNIGAIEESMTRNDETLSPSQCTQSHILTSSSANNACSSDDNFTVVITKRAVELKNVNTNEILKFDLCWLRYQCNCLKCYDEQLKSCCINPDELLRDMPACNVTLINSKQMQVKWQADHFSTYDIKELQLQLNSIKLISHVMWLKHVHISMEHLQNFSFAKLINAADNVRLALRHLRQYGILIVNEFTPQEQQQQQQQLLNCLFPQLCGPIVMQQEKRADFCQAHTIPFTNCTLQSADCGLQVLSMSENSDMLNLALADGYTAANRLYAANRISFLQLAKCKQIIGYSQARSGFQYQLENTVLQLKQNKYMERIHFAPYQLCRHFSVSESMIKAMHEFGQILKKQQNVSCVKMHKNQLIILDNYRICWLALQSTQSTAAAAAKIELNCSYIQRWHYMNRLFSLEELI